MSYRKRLLLVNNFIQTLESDIRRQIENFVNGDLYMDDQKVLSYFGLEERFMEYVELEG